ncbi:methyl-accepting chemotaxis protein [uncultured Caulobacter sp.]|uniref:methyl-accepting chemotaxis protein n=1 Tax=uncultured Caulobacter sp. TaxID=158749 RepID=UPI002625B141|nr:methyl-accepting chemotaxis protein [uncultured Caulobacter sp.]
MEQDVSLRPERILDLSERLSAVAGAKIGEIARVNRAAKMLAINALIVAARAGEAGKGFAIVAEEFKKISTEIDAVAAALESQVRADLDELSAIGGAILGHMRGQRLADLALNAIEIVDRNLYERTCDVRWWATDSAVVACLADGDPGAVRHASERLGVILDAYTVYLDLWICDTAGRVVANGRPGRYPGVAGRSVAEARWFQEGLCTASGDDFVACDIELSRALGDAPVATYATAIREGGQAQGKVLGVLGVHFDWRPQAQAVVEGVRLTAEERERSRVLLLDQKGRVLAASDGKGVLSEIFPLDISAGPMGSYADGDKTVGYALTPGYETYAGLGWYGCLVQRRHTSTETGVAA